MVRENGVQIGVNGAIAHVAFRSADGGPQRNLQNQPIVTPFNIYASFGPKDAKYKFGVAVYTPYGSTLKYAAGWEGRYALTEITLQSVYVQPTASYAITPTLSVGAGLTILAYGNVNLQRDAPLPTGDAHLTLDGKTKTQFGYNAGIFFKPSDKLSVGVSYRSKISAKVEDGDLTISGLPAAGTPSAGLINPRFTANKFSATLPLPAVASIGVGLMPTKKLTIGLDAALTFWSTYRTLDFAFSGNTGLINNSTTSSSKRYYEDALTFRLGGQYKVNDKLTVRAGTVYDMTAVKTGYVGPETPDADRYQITGGASYNVNEKFGIDASYVFESFLQRTQDRNDLLNAGTTDRVAGTYKTTIHIPGIGVHYNF